MPASRSAFVDPATGEARAAQLFVGGLGASNFVYAEATWTQALPDWVGAHIRMLEYFGSIRALIVPDNLKAGVVMRATTSLTSIAHITTWP